MVLAEDDHVIQAIPPNRPDQPLHVGVLPRAAVGGEDLSDLEVPDRLEEGRTVDRVAVPQEISRRRVPGERLADLRGDRWPSGSREPSPMVTKSPPLPGDYRSRLNDDEGVLPPIPDARDPRPDQAVGGSQARAMRLPLVDGELVTQGQDLHLERGSGSEEGGEERSEGSENGKHSRTPGAEGEKPGTLPQRQRGTWKRVRPIV